MKKHLCKNDRFITRFRISPEEDLVTPCREVVFATFWNFGQANDRVNWKYVFDKVLLSCPTERRKIIPGSRQGNVVLDETTATKNYQQQDILYQLA